MKLEIMRMAGLLPTIAMFAVAAHPCRAEQRPALKTAAEVRAIRSLSFTADRPISLTGVVTLVDPGRNLLVVEDETGAVALHPDAPASPLQPGQRVTVSAAGGSGFVANCPGFPYAPALREIRPAFEVSEYEGDYRLNRLRGWLRPPVTGDYTFWIASDDSSELWFSESGNPEEAKRVAMVPPGLWTEPREWKRFPSQGSGRIFLRAGESYPIEVVHEQAKGGSHLSVAWEGPGQELAVIDGKHLSPLALGPDENEHEGILRESWTGYSVAKVGELTANSLAGGELAVRGMEIKVLDGHGWPQPRPLDPGVELQQDDSFRWVEGSGDVRFMARDGGTATFELVSNARRFLLHVTNWHGNLPRQGTRWHAKFRGVCETGRDMQGPLVVACVWAPSESEVSFTEMTGAPNAPAEDGSLTTTLPPSTMGGGYFTRGVVTFDDEVLGKPCLFVQEALGGIFVSNRETTALPPLQAGHSVEIGGNLEQRKYSPAIRPLYLNILGRQNLPVPARPAAEKDYRDGLWTEMEGVVRVVQPDGTLLLAGKHATIPVWIGRTEREDLERLVDSALCVRGVMSLETWGHPLVLVPSQSFVEIKEVAPGISDAPSPIAALKGLISRPGWTHRVKVEGAVTYREDHGFYLQDPSGPVRVSVRDGASPAVGESVAVVGFADVEGAGICISEPKWQPGGPVPEVVPVHVGQPGAIRHGELVNVEGRLLSLAHRDGDLVLELQAGQQILEAVLEAPATSAVDFETGSLLGVTGVGLVASSARPQVLLRTVRDVVLLDGPPWWTWQRAALLIGVLVAVLAGTLLRLRFLHRRFERQQAARLAFSRGMLESQESERRRIAASLHDSLGQELLVIRNQAHFALQASSDDPALRRRLEEISETTLQAINEVREITRNLRPYQLDRLGLTQSIRALARKVSENSPIEFACHVDEVDDLFDSESEIHLYRIVQEALNNVLKHSGATEAAVVVKLVPGSLSISIRDNGRGLSAPSISGSSGFGLSGIKERAEIMGGATRLDSSPGQGVNLLVLLPLPTLHAKPDQSPDR